MHFRCRKKSFQYRIHQSINASQLIECQNLHYVLTAVPVVDRKVPIMMRKAGGKIVVTRAVNFPGNWPLMTLQH